MRGISSQRFLITKSARLLQWQGFLSDHRAHTEWTTF